MADYIQACTYRSQKWFPLRDHESPYKSGEYSSYICTSFKGLRRRYQSGENRKQFDAQSLVDDKELQILERVGGERVLCTEWLVNRALSSGQ